MKKYTSSLKQLSIQLTKVIKYFNIKKKINPIRWFTSDIYISWLMSAVVVRACASWPICLFRKCCWTFLGLVGSVEPSAFHIPQDSCYSRGIMGKRRFENLLIDLARTSTHPFLELKEWKAAGPVDRVQSTHEYTIKPFRVPLIWRDSANYAGLYLTQ